MCVCVRCHGTPAVYFYLSIYFYLIIFRGGDKEEDGGDGVEALEPASSLRPLPSNVHHLEGDILDFKVILMDTFGGFTGQ